MSGLGARYKCFKCQTKFYDLAAPQPICPACGENQNNDQSRKTSPKQKKKIYRPVPKEDIVIPAESEGLPEMGEGADEQAFDQAVENMEELTDEHVHNNGDIPEE